MNEWISTPKQPKHFIIQEEQHPLKKNATSFHVYYENMTPLYIGRDTLLEAEKALRQSELVRHITVIYKDK